MRGAATPIAAPVSIGRDASNVLALGDSGLSRNHCLIEPAGDGVYIRDLDSRNGTFVNGERIQLRRLQPGDRIKIGNLNAVFETEPPVSTSATMVLHSKDAMYLRSDPVIPATERSVRDLRVLLDYCRAIAGIRSEEALYDSLISVVFSAVPADRAAIVLTSGNAGDVTVLGRHRNGSTDESPVSRTVLVDVMASRAAVLSNDVQDDESLASSASLVMRVVSSVAAVPVELHGELTAVLYAESSQADRKFEPADLELLTALGSVTSVAVGSARQWESIQGENQRLREESDARYGMVGASPQVRQVLDFVERVAPMESNVLIWGESGTGKELVARAIHKNSPRALGQFIAINCAALTETLLESEMFGHEKGSFTGAVAQKKGKIELAEGGTLFLDEIGEMNPILQAKLLRVLQEKEFERVGGTKTLKADVRVIAATNRDLKEMSRTGSFRQDLYYRLNVISVRTPALRDRREDIPLLAAHFIQRFSDQTKRRVTGLAPPAKACLLKYDWPGNIRELQNAIERAVVMGSTDFIQVQDLPDSVWESAPAGGSSSGALHEQLNEAKREILIRAIAEADNNYTEAARRLDIHPNHLFRLVKTLDLTPKRKRAQA